MEITQEIREAIAQELEDAVIPQFKDKYGEWEKGFYKAQLVMIEKVRGEKESE